MRAMVIVASAFAVILVSCARQHALSGDAASPSPTPCRQLVSGCKATRLHDITLTSGSNGPFKEIILRRTYAMLPLPSGSAPPSCPSPPPSAGLDPTRQGLGNA